MGKPKSNHLISAKALHRPTLEAKRRSPTDDGPIWPQLGAGRPQGLAGPSLAPFGLNFGQLAHATSPNVGCMCFVEDLAWRMAVCSR